MIAYKKERNEQYLLVVGSGRNGPNSAGSIDVNSAPNFVNSLCSDDIQKNLFTSPQLHKCTINEAERSNAMGREGESED